MALFSSGVPRLLALGIVLTGFCVLPPEALSRAPELCLWRNLLHLAACPACGSTRALAAFFHGRFGDALAYNRNVLVTAPLLVMLAAKDALTVIRKVAWVSRGRPRTSYQPSAISSQREHADS